MWSWIIGRQLLELNARNQTNSNLEAWGTYLTSDSGRLTESMWSVKCWCPSKELSAVFACSNPQLQCRVYSLALQMMVPRDHSTVSSLRAILEPAGARDKASTTYPRLKHLTLAMQGPHCRGRFNSWIRNSKSSFECRCLFIPSLTQENVCCPHKGVNGPYKIKLRIRRPLFPSKCKDLIFLGWPIFMEKWKGKCFTNKMAYFDTNQVLVWMGFKDRNKRGRREVQPFPSKCKELKSVLTANFGNLKWNATKLAK